MDPQWKLKRLGNSSEATIGSYGCLLTDLAMIASVYGYEINPLELNDKMKSAGGFQGAYIMPYILSNVLSGMVYKGVEQCYDTPAPMAKIDAMLAQGKPVIIEVDYSPKKEMQNHWVVLYEKRDGDYLLYDPWPYPIDTGDILLTKSRYAFAGQPKEIITQVVFFDGKLAGGGEPEPEPEPKPEDPAQPTFTVYATVDGLAFRRQPFVSGDNLITRLPLNTTLGVLEDESNGKAKIGQDGEWLRVQDDSGQKGYVAAWYVALTKESPTPEPEPNPEPEPDVLVVKTTAESVALRKEPRAAPETIVRYLPLFTNLKSLEPLEQVKAKLGVRKQWLHVEDIHGVQGYIAARYLTASDESAFGPRKEPTDPVSGSEDTTLTVYAQVDQLAMRSQPLVLDTTLIKRLALNSDLIVVERAEDAQKKIGVVGEWLKVRDIASTEGFVAAWYVSTTKFP
jgi:hypothetical protein